MVKSDEDTIKEFNELVYMTPSELEKWLKVRKRERARCRFDFDTFFEIPSLLQSEESESGGWGDGDESVGHQRLAANASNPQLKAVERKNICLNFHLAL